MVANLYWSLCQLYSNTFMQYDLEMIIYELSNDIKQKEMHWEFTEIMVSKNMRHSSLEEILENTHRQFQVGNLNSN